MSQSEEGGALLHVVGRGPGPASLLVLPRHDERGGGGEGGEGDHLVRARHGVSSCHHLTPRPEVRPQLSLEPGAGGERKPTSVMLSGRDGVVETSE